MTVNLGARPLLEIKGLGIVRIEDYKASLAKDSLAKKEEIIARPKQILDLL